MKILKSIPIFKKWRSGLAASRAIGFVPTMGALHEGHFSLIKRARKENALVVVSIFVNPAQFGPKEDFSRYPRPWKADLKVLKNLRVDAVFTATPQGMYPPSFSTTLSIKGLNSVMDGAPTSRGSGHFDGVAVVVAKLFNIVRPTKAYFGLKDYQQVRIIEQMVEDLNIDVEIIRCPTVRAQDGLALSSRNAYLNPSERSVASLFSAALHYGRKLLTSKSNMTPSDIRNHVKRRLSLIPNARVEYVELVDPETLQRFKTRQRPALLAGAIRLGKTRLIDNIIIK